ncbi:MAG: hypothetical protein MZV70_37180 [Desulfobacterales bacterium]|nr:hypothetical protein [Desulfobacterales bacterium]
MRFAISTLGCKVNQYESQRIRQGPAEQQAISSNPSTEPGADCYIINTCTITHQVRCGDAQEPDSQGTEARRQGGSDRLPGCCYIPKTSGPSPRRLRWSRPDRLGEVLEHRPAIQSISGFGDHPTGRL